MISSELQHVQAHLNEVLNNWQQWNSSYSAMESYLNEAFERFEGDEAHIQLFLQDLDNWKSHYSMLQSTSSFLMEACDENIASNLQQKMAVIHCNWSYLLQVHMFFYKTLWLKLINHRLGKMSRKMTSIYSDFAAYKSFESISFR